jgi:preprotein translocase subunit SecG
LFIGFIGILFVFWRFLIMQVWSTLLLVVQILSAITMIGLVLVQHGKGADMGASFGSGSSGSLFGATGSANFLSRSTAICATVFFLSTLGMAWNNTHGLRSPGTSGGSILDQAAPPAGAASAAVGAIPTTPTTSVPAPAAPAQPAAAIPAPAAPAASR